MHLLDIHRRPESFESRQPDNPIVDVGVEPRRLAAERIDALFSHGERKPCIVGETVLLFQVGVAARQEVEVVERREPVVARDSTIQEDWRYITDAMRMRDVSPSLAGFLTHPGMTVECIYVPLLMAASKAADDLSVASVTRGIENPNPRTCLVQIKCGVADWGVMAVAVAYLIFELCVRGGVIG